MGTDDLMQKHQVIMLTQYFLTHWQNGRHFPVEIFEYIFVNENDSISIKIS